MSPVVIDSFEGEYRFLSNFADIPASYSGIEYPTAEHAFQAAKFLDRDYRQEILQARTPGDAKRLGRTRRLPIKDGWDDGLAVLVMAGIIRSKFAGGEPRDLLVGTGNAILIEGNRWHDNIWGDCGCGSPACETRGRNQLGIILMTTRGMLR